MSGQVLSKIIILGLLRFRYLDSHIQMLTDAAKFVKYYLAGFARQVLHIELTTVMKFVEMDLIGGIINVMMETISLVMDALPHAKLKEDTHALEE